MNYLVPPVFLTKNLEKCKCKCVLVVPYCSLSAVAWPLTFETKNMLKRFIKDTKLFYNIQEAIAQDINEKCFLDSDKLSFPILALNIDFS